MPSTSPPSPKERYKESSSDQYFPFLRQVMEMSPHSPRGLPVSMPATPTNRPAASAGSITYGGSLASKDKVTNYLHIIIIICT